MYRTHVGDLYNFIYSRTLDRISTEEVVSDTFYTLIDVIDSFDEKSSSIKTFLFGIALNKLRQKWASKKGVNSFISLDEELENTLIIKISPRRKRFVRKVTGAISKLSLKYQKIIEMRYTNYMSIKEVAKKLKISETNVTTLQGRAIKKLKEIINEE